jgi:hypothetical protein
MEFLNDFLVAKPTAELVPYQEGYEQIDEVYLKII